MKHCISATRGGKEAQLLLLQEQQGVEAPLGMGRRQGRRMKCGMHAGRQRPIGQSPLTSKSAPNHPSNPAASRPGVVTQCTRHQQSHPRLLAA